MCRLDAGPLRASASVPPAYRDAYSRDRRNPIRVRFVLDSSGRAQPGSVKLLSEALTLFASRVLQAVDSGRFNAQTLNGARVRTVIELEVRLATADIGASPIRPLWEEERTPNAFVWRVGREAVQRVEPEPVLSDFDHENAARAIFLAVPVPENHEPGRALCLKIPGSMASRILGEELLAVFREQRKETMPQGQCPHGALDPDFIEVEHPFAWTADILRASVRTGRGLSGEHYVCNAYRSADVAHGWRAECAHLGSWSS